MCVFSNFHYEIEGKSPQGVSQCQNPQQGNHGGRMGTLQVDGRLLMAHCYSSLFNLNAVMGVVVKVI